MEKRIQLPEGGLDIQKQIQRESDERLRLSILSALRKRSELSLRDFFEKAGFGPDSRERQLIMNTPVCELTSTRAGLSNEPPGVSKARILQLMSESPRREWTPGQLEAELEIKYQRVSTVLRRLHRDGRIVSNARGRWMVVDPK